MVIKLQKLTGHLNFINRAIVPGRAFTRRMYAKFSGKMATLKPYHHVRLDREFRLDCQLWELFLQNLSAVVYPFTDLELTLNATNIGYYSDATAVENLGYGVIFGNSWMFGKWEPGFIKQYQPSIEFLELFALCSGIITWAERLQQTRVVVFCDNISVVHMVNNLSLSCHQCMKLIRMLTLNNLQHDRRVFA